MFSERIGDLEFYFEILGKFACIKKIYPIGGIEKTSLKIINIPSEVHYNNYTYIVNSISGFTTTEREYKVITTDRRRKDYGKSVCTGEYTSMNSMLAPLDWKEKLYWNCEIRLPKTIKEIGIGAFGNHRYCSLKVVLNDGIKIIRTGAFFECNLNELFIPSSLKTIEEAAFVAQAWDAEKKLIIDNEPGAVKIHELAFCMRDNIHNILRKSKSEIVYLRPKTSLFAKLMKKFKLSH